MRNNVGRKQATDRGGNQAWANVLRWAAWGAIGGGAVLSVGGCEKMESATRAGDRKVDVAVDDSINSVDSSKEAGTLKAAIGEASPVGKARGSSELARVEFNQAMALVPEINRQAALAQAALFDLREAASQINDIQRTAGTYAQRDPKETLAKLDEDRATLQKAVEKAQSDAASLKAELDKRQQEIDALKAERQKADADAETLAEKSNNAKGQESVDLFKQSTDARAKSGTLAAQIEMKTAALMPIQHQLAMAEGQQKLYDNASKETPGAIQLLDDRKAQITAAWQDHQQKAQGISDSAKKLADGVITPGGTSDKPNAGARFVKAMEAGDKARAEAEKLLQSAAQHADDAQKAAKALHDQVSREASAIRSKSPNSPDLAALDAVIAAFDEKQYAVQKGAINTALGNLYANQYTLASNAKATLDQVSQALQASGQSLPSALVAPNPDSAKASAQKAYETAEEALESVINGPGGNLAGSKETKSNALASLLVARYGHYELTLDDTTRKLLKDDIARAKEAAVPVPNSLRNLQ